MNKEINRAARTPILDPLLMALRSRKVVNSLIILIIGYLVSFLPQLVEYQGELIHFTQGAAAFYFTAQFGLDYQEKKALPTGAIDYEEMLLQIITKMGPQKVVGVVNAVNTSSEAVIAPPPPEPATA